MNEQHTQIIRNHLRIATVEGWLSVTTCLPAGFSAAQPKPNKLQSLHERRHMEKVIKLAVSAGCPSTSVLHAKGRHASDVITDAAEAFSWSKFSELPKKMCTFTPRTLYIWSCDTGSFLANLLPCFLSEI